MTGDPEEEAGFWLRPVWETEDEADLEPPGPLRTRKKVPKPDFEHPLLTPLARAQNAVARLEAKTEAASAIVAEGLRARGAPGGSRSASSSVSQTGRSQKPASSSGSPVI